MNLTKYHEVIDSSKVKDLFSLFSKSIKRPFSSRFFIVLTEKLKGDAYSNPFEYIGKPNQILWFNSIKK